MRDGVPVCPVVLNRFSDRGPGHRFPLSELVIPLGFEPPIQSGAPTSTGYRPVVIWVPRRTLTQWDARGRLRVGPLLPPPGAWIDINPVTPHSWLVRSGDSASTAAGARPWPGAAFDCPNDSPINEFSLSPSGRWGIMREDYGTRAVANGASRGFLNWPWFAREPVPVQRTQGMALIRELGGNTAGLSSTRPPVCSSKVLGRSPSCTPCPSIRRADT